VYARLLRRGETKSDSPEAVVRRRILVGYLLK
jgi:hypothetical protein